MFELVELETQTLLTGPDGGALTFATFLDAKKHAEIEKLENHAPRKIRVTLRWQDREAKRLTDGTYKTIPLESDGWQIMLNAYPEHFAHMSRKQTGKIAYTENAKKGDGDVQTPIAFKDYVLRFGLDCEKVLLNSSKINQLITDFKELSLDADLHIIRDSDEMGEAIHAMHRTSLQSCMTSFSPGPFHPYQVYGTNAHNGVASDLTLATLKKDDAYVARAIVWEDKKLIGRIYGETGTASLLKRKLRDLGFNEGKFEGAKLKKLEDRKDRTVMPYLDDIQSIDDCSNHFKITNDGDIIANKQTGYLEDEEENDSYMCENCEESCEETYAVRTGRQTVDSWCEYCRDNDAFYCEGESEYFSDSLDSFEVDGRTYSLSYADNHFTFCDHAKEYTSGPTFEVIVSTNGETQTWLESSCDEAAFICRIDGLRYDNDLKSRHMTFEEIEAESFISIVNDERDSSYHAIPEQGELTLESVAA